MALSEAEIAKCAKWCTAPARKWQVLNRGKWKYQFHEKTLVRFVEEVKMDEELCPLLLEYLTSDDCRSTLQLYGQTADPAWTPIRAWYEISNKSVGSVHAIRLYHALAIEPEAIGDGPYLVEDGCAYKVSLTYYWRQGSVPQAPASESGISYHIINLSRDPENGLYSYAIEQRERVQQDIPEYVTGVTTTHETREEVHHGVRGELDAGGKQASVGGGKIVRRKVTKNADCTHDVHNETVKELASPKHSESVSVGLTGTVKTTTDLNMSEPLPTDGLDIGQHVENTKTEGGLWRRVFRKLVPNALIRIAESCRKTLFAHSHSNTTVQSNDPGFSHVEEAGGGVVHDKRVSRTADGAYQITDSTTTELPVGDASEATSIGLDGTVKTTHRRNQPSKAPDPTDIGESVENTKTPGGLWNQVIRKLIPNSMLKIAESCSKTLYAHRHSKSTVQSNDPGFSHVEEAGGGRIASKNVSRTHNGSYRIEEGETVEKPVPKAERTARMTLNGLSVRVVNRNQSAPLPDPTEVGKSVSNRRTDGGLYDTVETTEGEKPAGKTGESCSRDKFTHRHSVTKNEKELQNPETVFTTGQIVHKSGHLTGNGTANNTTETTTAVPQIQRYHWEDERGRHYVVKYRNQQSEINEAPSDADSVSLNDSVNAFGLHDGQCTYSYLAGRWKFSAKDYKFIKHGARQEYYDVKRRRRTRVWSHRKWIIEPRRIRGDAFWDYLNELARANPERTTPGTLGVKLIERYSDSDGNLLAEWVQVDLVQAEAWQVCDNDCKHAFVAQQMSNDHRFIINSLLASLS